MNLTSRIYVAGHTGLVGSAIVRTLETEGYRNVITRSRGELDLRHQTAVRAFFERERPEYVFLAAAKVGGIWANDAYPAEFIRDNLAIELNTIDESHRTKVRRLLFLGSSCIYPKSCPQPMREEYLLTGALEPTNEAYAVAKIAGVTMCQAYNRQYGTAYLAVMPTNLYGPGDNFDLMTSHVLPALIRKFHLAELADEGRWADIEADERRWGPIPADVKEALSSPISRSDRKKGPAVILWGTGSPCREFLHVEDLASACVFLMSCDDSVYDPLIRPGNQGDEPAGPEIGSLVPALINIGTGTAQTIREVAELIRNVVGYTGEVRWDASKPDGTSKKLLEVSRLRSLGWSPRITLRQGVQETYQWFLQASRQR